MFATYSGMNGYSGGVLWSMLTGSGYTKEKLVTVSYLTIGCIIVKKFTGINDYSRFNQYVKAAIWPLKVVIYFGVGIYAHNLAMKNAG